LRLLRSLRLGLLSSLRLGLSIGGLGLLLCGLGAKSRLGRLTRLGCRVTKCSSRGQRRLWVDARGALGAASRIRYSRSCGTGRASGHVFCPALAAPPAQAARVVGIRIPARGCRTATACRRSL
jgi:hypothetical protein